MSEDDTQPHEAETAAPCAAEDLIPPTPSADDYAEEARTQERFGAEDDQGDVFGETRDPLATFAAWLRLAREHEINDPNAMCIASVDDTGMPDARMVLLKDLDHGFTFYTNMQSAKGDQLLRHPKAAIVFHWKSIRRQVRIRGVAEPLDDEAADAYFATRNRDARIGAWASQQSREMSEAGILETRLADYEALFEGRDVPRPDFWLGFRIVPKHMEFWVNRPFRLHDRKAFERVGERWETAQLYP